MDRRVVHDWLRSVLVPYADPDRTFADVVSLLETFPSLSPRTDLYISNVGQSLLLLQLKGTIPMTFRGQTYNVPVEVWVNKAYPREPPIGYVSPTRDMLVRKTDEVDLDGLIGGEYQKDWSRKWESKSLLGFVQACQDIFSRQPPVYAKPPSSTPITATAAQSTATPGSSSSGHLPLRQTGSDGQTSLTGGGPLSQKQPPPLPGQGPSSSFQEAGSSGVPPLKPPKPGQAQHASVAQQRQPAPYNDTASPQHSSGSYRPAEISGPFHPTSNPNHAHYPSGPSRSSALAMVQEPSGQRSLHSPPLQRDAKYGGPYSPSRLSPASPTHTPSGGQWAHNQYGSPRSPVARQEHPWHPQNGEARRASSQFGPPSNMSRQSATPPPPRPSGVPPSTSSHVGTSSLGGGAGAGGAPLPPPRPQGDLLDSLAHDNEAEGGRSPGCTTPTQSHPNSTTTTTTTTGPPPPRPLNPELASLHQALHAKLSSRVEQLRSSLHASNAHLVLIGRDLDAGPPAIEDEVARLRAVLSVCQSRAVSLESSLRSVQARTAALHAREQLPPHEIILADSLVGDQLVRLVAQDAAIADLLYHLSRALLSEEIDLERYLKWVRLFGREQFLKKALAVKISRGLRGQGLGFAAVE